jgi:hypothetical protein
MAASAVTIAAGLVVKLCAFKRLSSSNPVNPTSKLQSPYMCFTFLEFFFIETNFTSLGCVRNESDSPLALQQSCVSARLSTHAIGLAIHLLA